MICKGEAMAIAETFIIVAVEAGFVAEARGAIGTCEGEVMMNTEAFNVAAVGCRLCGRSRRSYCDL